jgi:hypothetical protein
LRSFDSTKLKLYTDSAFQSVVTDCQFVKDSSNKKIVLQNKWKEQTLYHIILDKDFAVDEEGKKLLRNDTISSFTTKKLADYGSVKLTIRNVDMSKNPVLQFIAGNQLYKSYPLAVVILLAKIFFSPASTSYGFCTTKIKTAGGIRANFLENTGNRRSPSPLKEKST